MTLPQIGRTCLPRLTYSSVLPEWIDFSSLSTSRPLRHTCDPGWPGPPIRYKHARRWPAYLNCTEQALSRLKLSIYQSSKQENAYKLPGKQKHLHIPPLSPPVNSHLYPKWLLDWATHIIHTKGKITKFTVFTLNANIENYQKYAKQWWNEMLI